MFFIIIIVIIILYQSLALRPWMGFGLLKQMLPATSIPGILP
jgi:hypothetical protein